MSSSKEKSNEAQQAADVQKKIGAELGPQGARSAAADRLIDLQPVPAAILNSVEQLFVPPPSLQLLHGKQRMRINDNFTFTSDKRIFLINGPQQSGRFSCAVWLGLELLRPQQSIDLFLVKALRGIETFTIKDVGINRQAFHIVQDDSTDKVLLDNEYLELVHNNLDNSQSYLAITTNLESIEKYRLQHRLAVVETQAAYPPDISRLMISRHLGYFSAGSEVGMFEEKIDEHLAQTIADIEVELSKILVSPSQIRRFFGQLRILGLPQSDSGDKATSLLKMAGEIALVGADRRVVARWFQKLKLNEKLFAMLTLLFEGLHRYDLENLYFRVVASLRNEVDKLHDVREDGFDELARRIHLEVDDDLNQIRFSSEQHKREVKRQIANYRELLWAAIPTVSDWIVDFPQLWWFHARLGRAIGRLGIYHWPKLKNLLSDLAAQPVAHVTSVPGHALGLLFEENGPREDINHLPQMTDLLWQWVEDANLCRVQAVPDAISISHSALASLHRDIIGKYGKSPQTERALREMERILEAVALRIAVQGRIATVDADVAQFNILRGTLLRCLQEMFSREPEITVTLLERWMHGHVAANSDDTLFDEADEEHDQEDPEDDQGAVDRLEEVYEPGAEENQSDADTTAKTTLQDDVLAERTQVEEIGDGTADARSSKEAATDEEYGKEKDGTEDDANEDKDLSRIDDVNDDEGGNLLDEVTDLLADRQQENAATLSSARRAADAVSGDPRKQVFSGSLAVKSELKIEKEQMGDRVADEAAAIEEHGRLMKEFRKFLGDFLLHFGVRAATDLLRTYRDPDQMVGSIHYPLLRLVRPLLELRATSVSEEERELNRVFQRNWQEESDDLDEAEDDLFQQAINTLLAVVQEWLTNESWTDRVYLELLKSLNRSRLGPRRRLCRRLTHEWLKVSESKIRSVAEVLLARAQIIDGAPVDIPGDCYGLLAFDGSALSRLGSTGPDAAFYMYERLRPQVDIAVGVLGHRIIVTPGDVVEHDAFRLDHSHPRLLIPLLESCDSEKTHFVLVLTWGDVHDVEEVLAPPFDHWLDRIRVRTTVTRLPEFGGEVGVLFRTVNRFASDRAIQGIANEVNWILQKRLSLRTESEWRERINTLLPENLPRDAAAVTKYIIGLSGRLDETPKEGDADLARIIGCGLQWLAMVDIKTVVDLLIRWMEMSFDDPQPPLGSSYAAMLLQILISRPVPQLLALQDKKKKAFTGFRVLADTERESANGDGKQEKVEPLPPVEIWGDLLRVAPIMAEYDNRYGIHLVLNWTRRWIRDPAWAQRFSRPEGELFAMVDAVKTEWKAILLRRLFELGSPIKGSGETEAPPLARRLSQSLTTRLILGPQVPRPEFGDDERLLVVLLDCVPSIHRRRFVGSNRDRARVARELLKQLKRRRKKVFDSTLVHRLGDSGCTVAPGQLPSLDSLTPRQLYHMPRLAGPLLETLPKENIAAVLLFSEELPLDWEDYMADWSSRGFLCCHNGLLLGQQPPWHVIRMGRGIRHSAEEVLRRVGPFLEGLES